MEFNITPEQMMAFVMQYGMKVVAAIVIFIVGQWIAKLLVSIAQKIMRKSNVDATLTSFAGNILSALGMTLVIIASLSSLGIDTTSLAAVIAAAGLAIGLALQGSLSNFASGVMIILFRPFKIGDLIEAADVLGHVEDISIFTTSVVTLDNRLVIVPNGTITSGNIKNISAKPELRVDLTVGVSYSADLKQTKAVLQKVLDNDPRVLKSPEYTVAVSELGDSSVNFVVRPFVKNEDYWDAYFGLTESIKIALDEAGISIPFPQRDIHIIQNGNGTSAKEAVLTGASKG